MSPHRAKMLTALCACGAIRVMGAGTSEPAAELVITGARIWTGNLAMPEAQAVAIGDGRILHVGTDAEIEPFMSPMTKIIRGNGRRVIPGIIDAHAHVVSAGLQMDRLDLRTATSQEQFVRRVRERADEIGPGQWILGGRWTVDSWADATPPSKEWIDSVTPRNPAFLSRMDGHMALANSAALKLAGISREGPPDPQGGRIDRDPTSGEPTGLLRDDAMELIGRHIPEPTNAELDAALKRAVQEANRQGVTMAHDMSEWRDIETFARACRSDDPSRLTLRIYSFYSTADWTRGAEQLDRLDWRGTDMFRVAGFKGYMDGSLGSRTAYMAHPFADNAPEQRDWRGLLVAMSDPPSGMRERCLMADRAGHQTAVHAIGDQANHLLLDIHEQVATRNGSRDRRPRIEHAQHLVPADIPRFAELAVIASMQPFHKADDGRYAEEALGKERLAGSYAFRSLLAAGTTVAFGSDWPVVTNNPFLGISTAVTGRTADGRVWLSEENISVEDALRCYTMGGAMACFMEDRLGSIEPGKYADLLVLDRDLLSIPTDELAQVRPVMTIVGGRVVFSAEVGDAAGAAAP